MSPHSTVPPEAPTLPLEELGSSDGDSQITISPVAAIDAGTVLAGRYRLLELIGEGGMSRVYKAEDQGAEAAVIAVKVLTRPFAESAGRYMGLSTQVHRWRRLIHPSIVRLFDCGRDGSIAFITMEYLPGESTYATLHQRPVGSPVPLDGAQARAIIAAVAQALDYAHTQGVVHGDLKPGNVMVTPERIVKVIDFGLTRWLARPGAPDLATTGAFAATAHYASPQLLAGEEPAPSDDVFGLACVAYELLTGVHPFDGEAGARTVQLPPPQRPGITPSEYAALTRALESERARRTSTIRQFLAEFAPPPPRPLLSRWPLGIGAAALAIAVAYFWPSSKPAPPSEAARPVAAPQAPAPVRPPQKAGSVVRDCSDCPAMTVLPAGQFDQGAADDERDALPFEKPQHRVHIDYPLAMSADDITVDDFRQFAEATGREMKGCDVYEGDWRQRATASWKNPGFTQAPRHPVVCVSWNDALAYAGWLSAKTGHKYRLPSASEWEYAARAGAGAARPWGADQAEACANANVADRSAERRYPGWSVFPCDDGYVHTAPVGAFKVNAFGLSDVLGNVLVWTEDCWQSDYADAPNDGAAREIPNCRERELRGGSWFSAPAVVKASYRNHFAADYRASSLGFRLVREMDR
jgi:formylglycine-generating enzyme required for sulfatase activity